MLLQLYKHKAAAHFEQTLCDVRNLISFGVSFSHLVRLLSCQRYKDLSSDSFGSYDFRTQSYTAIIKYPRKSYDFSFNSKNQQTLKNSRLISYGIKQEKSFSRTFSFSHLSPKKQRHPKTRSWVSLRLLRIFSSFRQLLHHLVKITFQPFHLSPAINQKFPLSFFDGCFVRNTSFAFEELTL